MRPSLRQATLAIAAFLLIATSSASADTLLVPSEYPTIQAAIDAAVDGDEVEIADGTYTGDGNTALDFGGKAITVCSDSGDPDNCIIDCKGSGRGFYFHNGEESNSVVQGLTITGGHSGGYGGGIYCVSSRPLISNCTISGNSAYFSGGGVGCNNNSRPMLINCTISGNQAQFGGGGGVWCLNSKPTITNCTINLNSTGDGGGSGGGVYCLLSHPTLFNCTINKNGAKSGGGVYCKNSNPKLINCTIWGNSPEAIYATLGQPTVTYSVVQNGSSESWFSEGCVVVDPQLTSDGHLTVSSPCINAGDPNRDYIGQLDKDSETRVSGGRIDIGSDEWHDGDGDGLPDWWERRYYGAPLSADPLVDDDGDGLNNLAEYEFSRNPLSAPVTYYVALSGNDDWDGLSPIWDGLHGPKATVQAAINACHSYETDTVEIADGTYIGVGNKDLDFGGKVITVRSTSGNPSKCMIDCEGSGRGFYFHSCEGENSKVNGMAIENGSGDTSGRRDADGGGILFRYDSNPTISNCIISMNAAAGTYGNGGGIYCDSSYPAFVDCAISENSVNVSYGIGGGVYCVDCSPKFTNCTISENSAKVGGGVYCKSSKPTFSGCILRRNSAYYDGGGICCVSSNPLLHGCTIARNSAISGGGVYCDQSHPVLIKCDITENSINRSGYIYGGGVYCRASNPSLSHCTINGNLAYTGGGVCCYGSSPSLSNCLLIANEARIGGGVYCDEGGLPMLSSCTIVENSGPYGSGVSSRYMYLELKDSVIWGNGSNGIELYSNQVLTHCLVQNGSGKSWFGEGCIDADPLFVDPDGPDNDPNTWEDNDYRLQPGSPCIDAGDNAAVPLDEFDLDNDGDPNEPLPVDLSGLRRFFDDPNTPDTGLGEAGDPIVDMGAYEFGAAITPGCVGDLNCDGAVNTFDIDPFIIALLQPAQYEQLYPDCNRLYADAQANGLVNAFDIDPFIEVLLAGGSGTCP